MWPLREKELSFLNFIYHFNSILDMHAGETKGHLDTSDSDADPEMRATGVRGRKYAQNTCGKQWDHDAHLKFRES